MNYKKLPIIILLIVVLSGLYFRFYGVLENRLVYYDEGMYLAHNIDEQREYHQAPSRSFSEFSSSFAKVFHDALSSGKFLWFLLCNLRVFLFNPDHLYIIRLLSAIAGSITIYFTYILSKRLFESKEIAFMSTLFIALMPSHIYYSRLAMQESLSTLLFIAGIYCYLFIRKTPFKALISGVLFACVFFVNYRMIITPFLVGFVELYLALSEKRKFRFRSYVYSMLVFLIVVFGLGALDGGANTRITFAWMFHQAHLAKGSHQLLNYLSYPYYLFKFEGVVFASLFFLNMILIFKKKYKLAFPFCFVLLAMVGFTLAQEKGVRYLCAFMPFMAISCGVVSHYLIKNIQALKIKKVIFIGILLGIFMQYPLNANIVNMNNDYRQSVLDIKQVDRNAKILSTQPTVQSLYTSKRIEVLSAPKLISNYFVFYAYGYRYLIIDPQVFISYTADQQRFSQTLVDHLQLVVSNITPIKEYEHFSTPQLERFVLEHNQNLWQSLQFLRVAKKGGYNKLRVYLMKDAIREIMSDPVLSKRVPVKFTNAMNRANNE